ncbi:MAG: ABC transporter [Desulfobacteraceae bacterium 4484_190.2]|nr:ABC transporter permease subunit [Deltaproteobacteria bacterium]OPX37804.1 MAG: ABC transporter [Desulfobacteraceae bacterium 4484_190.2]
MRQVIHIFNKEFKAYFVSPIAYIVISVFLIVTGWFFFTTFFLYNQATLRNFFALLPTIFSFVVPAVTMRLFSEELNVGSYETLLTLPVTFQDVILGKFLAAVVFVAAMLIPTLAYPVAISFLGQLDWGPVLGGYVGALLLGAAFSAIGLFASSLTRNQIIAFILSMAICFSLTLIDNMLFFLPQPVLSLMQYMGTNFHFQNISKGILDSRDILYFLSISFVGLYGAHLALQEKN